MFYNWFVCTLSCTCIVYHTARTVLTIPPSTYSIQLFRLSKIVVQINGIWKVEFCCRHSLVTYRICICGREKWKEKKLEAGGLLWRLQRFQFGVKIIFIHGSGFQFKFYQSELLNHQLSQTNRYKNYERPSTCIPIFEWHMHIIDSLCQSHFLAHITEEICFTVTHIRAPTVQREVKNI